MRKFLKLFLMWISSILYHNKKSKIVFYHDVYGDKRYQDRDTKLDMSTSLDIFNQHIQTIRDNGFKITDKITKPEGEVMICFDDGFKGIYDTRSYFIGQGLRPTVFIAVSLIGQPGYLDVPEIRELQQAGFIFQCHAWSHKDLTSYSKDELVRELYESKKKLEEILGKKVDGICFPIGYFSQLVLDECKRYGYKVMYSSIPGNFDDKIYVDGLKTRNLLQFADVREVKLMLNGGNEMIRGRYVKMHWKD